MRNELHGHPSAAGQTQDRESSPAKYRRSTTVLYATNHVILQSAV